MNAGELLSARGLDTFRLRLLIYPVQPESVRIRPAPRLLRSAWGEGTRAMTLRRTIFLDPGFLEASERRSGLLLIHELVHVRQWLELGIVGFLWRYAAEYLKGRFSGSSHHEAYLEIELEVEARRLADLV